MRFMNRDTRISPPVIDLDSAVPMTFDELQVPQRIGYAAFRPDEAAVKKFAYAVEDDSGWVLTDRDGRVRLHPLFLATYMWWPQGFYVQEPTGSGHFYEFLQRFGALVKRPYLHTKTQGTFHHAPEAGTPIYATVDLVEKFEKREKDYVVIGSSYHDGDGRLLAEYRNTAMIRSHVTQKPSGARAPEPEAVRASFDAPEPTAYETTVTLANSRLFSLPFETFHTHDSIARDAGFAKVVPQGLMSWGYLARLCEGYFGAGWAAGGLLEVTYAGILQRDDVLTVAGRVTGVDDGRVSLALTIDNAEGRRVAVGSASGVLPTEKEVR